MGIPVTTRQLKAHHTRPHRKDDKKTNRWTMDSSPTATQVRNNNLAADTRPANRTDSPKARIPGHYADIHSISR